MKFSIQMIAAAASALLTLPSITTAQDATKDEVLATVDGTPIMMEEMREMIVTRFGRQLQQVPEAQRGMMMQRVQQMVMQELVSRTLLLNSANKEGIKITDAEMDERLESITKGLTGGMTLEDVLKSAGMTLEGMKKRLSEDAKVGKLVEQVTKDIKQPGTEEVKKYYDEHPDQFEQASTVSASHILISTKDITDPIQLATKEALVKDLQKQLKAKDAKSFEELATAHSDCPSKARGGSLGEFGKGQMVPEFEKAAFSQEVGKIGEAVKTDFGYHIIKVTDRKEGKTLAFAEVEKNLASQLFDEAKRQKVSSYVEGLHKEAKIVIPGAPEVPAPK